MYHPSRGGVRGGADQFDWENVKTDKHRENYLGHSLKAPVGRWQKGKDLLWYSKDRDANKEEAKKAQMSEMANIKKAEEEAMLAALGHKVVKKEVNPLTNEEMIEVLKRNNGQRDSLNVERVEGVGISGSRTSMIVNCGKQKGTSKDGISSRESPLNKDPENSPRDQNIEREKSYKSSKKSSKHHKKGKKNKKKKKSEKRHFYSESSDDSGEGISSSKRQSHKRLPDFHDSKKSSQSHSSHAKHGSTKDKVFEHKNKRTRHDSSSDGDVDSQHKGHVKNSYRRSSENVHRSNKVCNDSPKRKRYDSSSD